jgi:predicted nucleic acid-binding protein
MAAEGIAAGPETSFMSGGRAFFDTNVLVYLFDESSPAKQVRAREIFEEYARVGLIVLSPQVLQEFYVTVIRKLAKPLSQQAALATVEHLHTFPLVSVAGATVLRAIQLHQSATLSFWDALIIQTALEGDCKKVFSEDLQTGRKFRDLVIENPFAAVG